MNDDDNPTDHYHHLLDDHDVSGNSYEKIRCLIACIDNMCPVVHAIDGVSSNHANYQHTS